MSDEIAIKVSIRWTLLGLAALWASEALPVGRLAAWAVERWPWAFYSATWRGAQ